VVASSGRGLTWHSRKGTNGHRGHQEPGFHSSSLLTRHILVAACLRLIAAVTHTYIPARGRQVVVSVTSQQLLQRQLRLLIQPRQLSSLLVLR
jgi:hypothetical protein